MLCPRREFAFFAEPSFCVNLAVGLKAENTGEVQQGRLLRTVPMTKTPLERKLASDVLLLSLSWATFLPLGRSLEHPSSVNLEVYGHVDEN